MKDLLQNYSITEILMFFVIAALAIKGVVSFFDWAIDRMRKHFDKEFGKNKRDEEIDGKLKNFDNSLNNLNNSQKEFGDIVNKLASRVEMLIESDRDDIKSFLTKEHHYFCYQQKWIDDYSLECCERRFAHYQAEGGNSFIAGFMDELRQLPKRPPQN